MGIEVSAGELITLLVIVAGIAAVVIAAKRGSSNGSGSGKNGTDSPDGNHK